MTSTAYMCKNRHGTYYARFVIPKNLQPHFNNKREIRRSLQTDSRKLAIKRARAYRVQFETAIDSLMNRNDDAYKKRVSQIVDEILVGKAKRQAKATEKFVNEMLAAKHQDDDGTITTRYITFVDLRGNEVKIDTGCPEQDVKIYKEIASIPDKAELERREKRAEELHQAQLAAIAAGGYINNAPSKPINPKKLSEYLKDYIEFKIAPTTRERWNSPETRKTMERDLERFCLDANDIPAAAFDWEQAKRYIKLAYNIPAYFRNKDHKKKFVGITIESILDDSIDTSMLKTRKPSTIWNDLKKIRSFLEWMRADERVKELQDAVDAFDSAIRNIDPTSKRRAFLPEELKTLFDEDNPSLENYTKGFNAKRGIDANLKYWLPLLGLYTGATIAELCQLHLSDIRQHKAFDGSEHWVIDIFVDSEKKAIDEDVRLKTESRPRLIPIHKTLLDLGFVDYVQKLKSDGEIELFPLSKRSDGKYGKGSFGSESQWWGEYSGKAGVDSPDVVFHSFRTTLSTYLRRNHVDRDIIAAIDGHSIKTTAEKYYNDGGHRESDIGPLVEAINKIDYGLVHHPFKVAP